MELPASAGKETGMSHLKSIVFQSEETHMENLRERLRKMTDEELIKFGKLVRSLSAGGGRVTCHHS
jgi:hypothetical protein